MRLHQVALLALAILFGAEARASIVERVVAVVGEHPIFMSELHARARPHLVKIQAANVDPARAAALETALYEELLDRMIDERIEADLAAKARVTVSPAEIDLALASVARAAGLDVPGLLAEAARQGLAEADYRAEIGRQILEGKLLQLRARPTDANAWESARRQWLLDARRHAHVEVRL